MPEATYSIGKPFDISELRKTTRKREPSPRDLALTKAVRNAAAAAESQVIPFHFNPDVDKVATIKLAAKRIVAELNVPVNVGYNAARSPSELLLSRGVLSNKGRRKA